MKNGKLTQTEVYIIRHLVEHGSRPATARRATISRMRVDGLIAYGDHHQLFVATEKAIALLPRQRKAAPKTRAPSILHPTNGTAATYCGPTAIASITGVRIGQAEDHILAYRGMHGNKECPVSRRDQARGVRVKAVTMYEITTTLTSLGFDTNTYSAGGTLTLVRWAAEKMLRGTVGIVRTRSHVLAISKDADGNVEICDTAHRSPTPIGEARKYKRSKVYSMTYVTKGAAPQQEEAA